MRKEVEPDVEDILLKGAKEGNEFAFAQIVERYEKRVYQLCYRMTGNPEDAADQTQETFLKAWRGLPSFQGDCALGTWLHRLAVNCCIDYLRREKKRRAQVTSLDASGGEAPPPEQPDSGPGPQEQLEQRERQRAVQRALEKLTLEHRAVLLLRESQGLSYGEIARALGLEEGTVKSRLARARLQLRNVLKKEGTFFP